MSRDRGPAAGPAGAVAPLLALWLLSACQGGPREGPALKATGPASGRPIGGALGCRKAPAFVAALGFPPRSALSTGERDLPGLALVDDADPGHSYQHPSWSRHGFFGPITYDADGNVYVAPTPNINLLANPPEAQNTLYRADGTSGELVEFLRLVPAAPPSADNPFGILGLTYDCDTGSLYSSSVSGSGRHSEVGRIVQIDATTGVELQALEGIDVIGLAVFNSPHGKRLYFGAARSSEIRSVALDERGGFVGSPRVDIKLPGWGDKARRISFDEGGAMHVVGVPFDFTLVVYTNERLSEYRYAYDAATDGWRAEPAP